MRSQRIVHIVSCHAEGEVGDVIVGGVAAPVSYTHLATVQQASLGLGSALLGAVFAHRLERHGDYLEATQTTLAVEFVLMTLLLGATCLFYLRRVRTVPLRCDSPGN